MLAFHGDRNSFASASVFDDSRFEEQLRLNPDGFHGFTPKTEAEAKLFRFDLRGRAACCCCDVRRQKRCQTKLVKP